MKNLMILFLALVAIAAFCDAQIAPAAPPAPSPQLNDFSNLFFSWVNGLVAGATGMTSGEFI